MKNKHLFAFIACIAGPLALLASPATDRKIEDAAKASCNYRTVLEDNVKVKAHDGVVTLTGTVQDQDNRAQKELTGIYAAEIDGVKTVKNDIVITDKPTVAEKIDDASITSHVKYALLTHKATSAVKTKVVTSDGVVLVTGEAASDAERSLVTKLAKDVRGVTSVTNKMTVRHNRSTKTLSRHRPLPSIDRLLPAARQGWVHSSEVSWQP